MRNFNIVTIIVFNSFLTYFKIGVATEFKKIENNEKYVKPFLIWQSENLFLNFFRAFKLQILQIECNRRLIYGINIWY